MSVKRALFSLLGLLGGLVLASGGGCGNDAVGVDTCREVESARCKRATECGLPLDMPVPAGDPVEACIRFYDTACLHGLKTPDPKTAEKNACLTAIRTGACSVVQAPESEPSCVWLVPVGERDAAVDSDNVINPLPGLDAAPSAPDATPAAPSAPDAAPDAAADVSAD